MIYLDHAASTPLLPEALEALMVSQQEDFANPSSSHKLGVDLLGKINQTREHFLNILQASSNYNFYFTSSATESNNAVLNYFPLQPHEEVILSTSEHPSLTRPVKHLIENTHARLKELPLLPDSSIDWDQLGTMVTENTRLLVLSHVHNQTGIVRFSPKHLMDLRERFPKLHVHMDGVQAFGKIPFSLESQLVHSYSISAHKMGGPKGIAGLYISKKSPISPWLLGGGQENGFRSSTQSWPLIHSFWKATELSWNSIDAHLKATQQLFDFIILSLKKDLPKALFPFNSGTESLLSSPYVMSIILPKVPGDVIMRFLEESDIYVSTSSACSSKIKGANQAFTSLGIPLEYHKNVLRISLAPATTKEDIDCFLVKLNEAYHNLSSLMANL